MSTPEEKPNPLFPPYAQDQNPYTQGIPASGNPNLTPPPAAGPYGPPPPQAYQNPVGTPYPYPYPQPSPYGNPYGYNTTRINQPSLWSMISALAGIMLIFGGIGFLGILAALPLGHIGLSQIKKNPQTYTGKGFAITGLVIGYIMLALSALVFLLIILAAAASSGYSTY